MGPRDIYDDMPDGEAQRRLNKQRLAELERDGAARRVRIAAVLALADQYDEIIQAASPHSL
jgi:hypothetical protein